MITQSVPNIVAGARPGRAVSDRPSNVVPVQKIM